MAAVGTLAFPMLLEELIRTCLESGNQESWEELVRRCHRLLATVALRVARRWGATSPGILDDLIQETYLKLCADGCRLLREFKSQHPNAIFGYLKVVTANVVHDHFKKVHSMKRGAGLETLEAGLREAMAGEEHAGSAETIEREILLQEIDACLRIAGPTAERDRRIFWLYYRQGLSAKAIASLPSIGLSTKGVESTILRLTRLIRSEIGERRAREGWRTGQPAEKGINAQNRSK